jgi:hypothetical protein
VANFFEYLYAVLAELIPTGLRVDLLVVVFEVAEELDLALGDDADVHVGAGAQVVVDTRLDRCDHELDRIVLLHVFFVVGLQDSHGREGTRTRRVVRVRIHVAVTRAFYELGALAVHSSHDKVGADVPTILEGVRGQLQGCHLYSVLSVCV